GGVSDGFLSKLNAAGNTLVYSTYAGSAGTDEGLGVAVDGSGFVYITGRSTAGPNGGFDAYAGKFQLLGGGGTDLVWYVFLGGSGDDVGYGIDVTPAGSAYVTGQSLSTNYPTTANAFNTTNATGSDAIITVLSAAGNPPSMVYSSYLGTSGSSAAHAVTIDPSGNAYIAGETD